jgi:hypothetical protein
MKDTEFFYTLTLKLHEMKGTRTSQSFPSVNDLTANSRAFNDYIECVSSVKYLIEGVLRGQTNFTINTEVNPAHTGIETRSKDWASNEFARLWLVPSSEVGKQSIRAVGQARIFGQPAGQAQRS